MEILCIEGDDPQICVASQVDTCRCLEPGTGAVVRWAFGDSVLVRVMLAGAIGTFGNRHRYCTGKV